MSKAKTQATDVNVETFLAAIPHPTRQSDAQTLDALFRRITGWTPRMWGPTIVGYGAYHYVYDSGHEGDSLATGFSPRKANLVLYIMPGYLKMDHMLARLGKHKIGKSCLYINKLADVDMNVVEEIIRAGLADLGTRHKITPG